MSIFEELYNIRRLTRIGFGGGSSPLSGVPLEFSSCAATSRFGPTQAQADTYYAGSPLEGLVTVTVDGIQEFTAPVTGEYLLEAYGANGGRGKLEQGGFGVYAKGSVVLEEGTILKIACGQSGLDSTNSNNYASGGGGGMSLVVDTTSTAEPLICAGGGGGGGYYWNTVGHALITTNGSDGYYGTFGAGGTLGSGGGAGQYAGGGAGYKTDGVAGSNAGGGDSFLLGALLGGTSYDVTYGAGGFGGGGGSYASPGGGGGYSGGGGGGYTTYSGTGGGGGSYVHARLSNTALVASANTGTGFVTITLSGSGVSAKGLRILPRKGLRL